MVDRVVLKNRLLEVSKPVSIALNLALGGLPGQTFCARQYERHRCGKVSVVFVLDKLFWFDSNHCLCSWVDWHIYYRKR